jgi:hypothetical protein
VSPPAGRRQNEREARRPDSATWRLRRKGQALVEFAVVAPVLLMIMIFFFQAGAVAYNSHVALGDAARRGLQSGNEQLDAVIRSFARDSLLTTPVTPGAYNPVFDLRNYARPSDRAAAACREGLTGLRTSRADYPSRLGWDWGCSAGWASLSRAPLTEAAREAWSSINQGWLGPRGRITIRACYIARPANPALISAADELMCLITVDGQAGAWSSRGNLANQPAPSLLRVTIEAPGVNVNVPGLSLGVFNLSANAVTVVDRFLPPCPAPEAVRDVVDGSCGDIF